MSKPLQFPLALKVDDSATFSNFWPGANLALIHLLKEFECDQRDSWLFIAGAAESGKSHLLQATSIWHGAEENEAIYFSFRELMSLAGAELDKHMVTDLFDAFEHYKLICLDDVHLICGNAEWEEALFYLLVKLKAKSDSRLLVSASNTPQALGVELPDLLSRLNSATVFRLEAHSDEDKINIITHRATSAGLVISKDVAAFIVKRYSRSLASLVEAIDKLDSMGLSYGRKLTVPFAKQVLSI